LETKCGFSFPHWEVEALMSTLPEVVCVMNDRGIGQRVLVSLQGLLETPEGLPEPSLELIRTGAAIVNAFVQRSEDDGPCASDTKSDHPKDHAPENDYEMLQNALLDADGDVNTCHILASKQGETLNTLSLSDADRDQDRPAKSAPGRLENESSSACSSWCRAALALPNVETTSDVTADPWEKVDEERAKPVEETAKADAKAQEDSEAAKAITEAPEKPPGVFQFFINKTCSGVETMDSSIVPRTPLGHNEIGFPPGLARNKDPVTSKSTGSNVASSPRNVTGSSQDQGSKKPKNRQRRKRERDAKYKANEEKVVCDGTRLGGEGRLDEMD